MKTETAQEGPSSLSDRIARCVEEHGRPQLAFFTTYTFSAEWFVRELLPVIAGEAAMDELNLGLLVVCDASQYRGHRLGPWVKLWSGPQLFHPKISLLVFEKATVLLAGSANLTREGQERQVELMAIESWSKRGVPEELVPLLSKIGGPLAEQLISMPSLKSKTFHLNINMAFDELSWPTSADELIVISPFYDKSSQLGDGGDPLAPGDFGLLDEWLERLNPDQVTLLAPIIEESISGKGRVAVQAPKGFISRASKQRSFSLYGVGGAAHKGRTLHAKLLAVRSGDTVRILMGSANATRSGMQRGGNIEAGWFTSMSRKKLNGWLKSAKLLDRQLDPNECDFQSPKPFSLGPQCPLLTALLDERTGTLDLEWRESTPPASASIEYGSRKLGKGPKIREVALVDDWHLTVHQQIKHRKYRWQVPIEVRHELPGTRRYFPYGAEDPEQLLASITSAPIEANDEWDLAAKSPTFGQGHQSETSIRQRLHERVRTLADAMAEIGRGLVSSNLGQVQANISLLLRIAKAHDPATPDLAQEDRLWRQWVRAEAAHLLKRTSNVPSLKKAKTQLNGLLSSRRGIPKALHDPFKLIATKVAS